MKLIDLDQQIFVPIVDEGKGGVTYEMQMTVEQFFRRFFNEVPHTIDAIPVEWIQAQVKNEKRAPLFRRYADALLIIWQKEQEAQDGKA